MKLRLDYLKQNNLLLASKDSEVLIFEQVVNSRFFSDCSLNHLLGLTQPELLTPLPVEGHSSEPTFDTVLNPPKHSS